MRRASDHRVDAPFDQLEGLRYAAAHHHDIGAETDEADKADAEIVRFLVEQPDGGRIARPRPGNHMAGLDALAP